MRVLVAGATGVVGVPTVHALRSAGHTVLALGRKPEVLASLQASGVETAVADALDAQSVLRAFEALRPDAVIHQLTALPANIRPKRLEVDIGPTNRLRVEGTAHLVAAARAVGAARFVAQSIGFVMTPGEGVAGEDTPLYLDAPTTHGFRAMVEATASLEQQTVAYGGVALRYGLFYGPGTVFDDGGAFVAGLRARRIPVVGEGTGMFSFVHVGDAAAAAVCALDAKSGVYHVADDEPAPAREVLPELAAIVGAKQPWRVPEWLGRLAAGPYGVHLMVRLRAVSTAKAKAALGWRPQLPSWREGMRTHRTRAL